MKRYGLRTCRTGSGADPTIARMMPELSLWRSGALCITVTCAGGRAGRSYAEIEARKHQWDRRNHPEASEGL
jgi:hypothetical protein